MDDRRQAADDTETTGSPRHPSFGEAFRFWLKLGFISFGGPAGQIAIMHNVLVERKRWVSNTRFLNALNYCMLLPGPEAQQLAIYIGWLLHRIPGGIVAGALFVIPSMFILLALSFSYAAYGDVAWVAAIFSGLKAAVMAVVVAAVIKIGRKALKNFAMILIAAMSFIAIFGFQVPFPYIVIGSGLLGYLGSLRYPDLFDVIRGHEKTGEETGYVSICAKTDECHTQPSRKRGWLLVCAWGLLWLLPVLLIHGLALNRIFYDQALFFTKAAFMTFGGAYAVLAYIAQAGVGHFGWLTGTQMIDGLGLAETTPGPLIMVVQFVGFMGGWSQPGPFSPFMGGLIGSLTATYFTFLPCFFFIFLGGPYIEKLRNHRRLSATLSSITAAVVGVILNLAVWFGLQVLFPPEAGLDGFAAFVGLGAFIALQFFRIDILPVILAAGGAGLIRHHLL